MRTTSTATELTTAARTYVGQLHPKALGILIFQAVTPVVTKVFIGTSDAKNGKRISAPIIDSRHSGFTIPLKMPQKDITKKQKSNMEISHA